MPIPVSVLFSSPRRLLTAIVLFVALDLAVLVINLWLTEQLAHDAVAINLAGRQRMLSQQSTKALLLITQPTAGQNALAVRAELDAAFGLFEHTLHAFSAGGEVQGGDGRPTRLSPLGGEGARILDEARALIAPIAQSLADASKTGTPEAYTPAAIYLVQHNEKLLTLMNRLTSHIEQESVHRAANLRAIQTGAFVLALVNFLVIVIGMLRQYHKVEQDNRHWREAARHDPLTGLSNRKAFADAARGLLPRAARDQQCGALLLLDLDGFKAINDRFGHPAGDNLLTMLANRLLLAARATDIVARLGGDEFIILCPLLQGENDIGQFCERLISTVAGIPRDDFPGCSLGVSIGVACYPKSGFELDKLLEHADQAMYAAKAAGGSCWRIA